MRAIGILLFAVAGCGTAPNPLQSQIDALAALEKQPLTGDWPAQATLEIGDPLLAALVRHAADQIAQKPPPELAFKLPLGATAHALPHVGPPTVTLEASDACAYCIAAHIAFDGDVTVKVDSAIANASGKVPYHAKVDGVVEVASEDRGDALAVVLKSAARDRWNIHLDFHGDSPVERELTPPLEKALVAAVLDGPFAEPVVVSALKQGDPVHVRGLRAYEKHSLDVDLAFAILHTGKVGRLVDPREGFAVVIPEETLLGIVEAAVLKNGPIKGMQPEIKSVRVDGGRFEIGLRVWKIARAERWRDFKLAGDLGLAPNGDLTFKTDHVEEGDHNGWLTPIDPLIQGAVMDALERAVRGRVPGDFKTGRGDGALTVSISNLKAENGVLVLRGSIAE